MKKRVTIIAYNLGTLNEMYNHLIGVFGDIIEFKKYVTHDYLKIEEDDSDLIVISGVRSYKTIMSKLYNKKYIISTRYINYNKLELLSDIKDGMTLYVVNDEKYSSLEVIKQLKDLGYNYDFHPYYPGLEVNKDINVAITIGELAMVPKNIEKVYDIGIRIFSISTIANIAFTLGLSYDVIDTIMWNHMHKYIKLLKRNKNNLKNIYNINQIMKSVFDDSKEGLVIVNHKGEVVITNSMFLKMIGLNMKSFIGKNFYKVLSNKYIDINLKDILESGSVIKNYEDKNILINANIVESCIDNTIIIYASYTNDVWKKEVVIRRETYRINTKAKYIFDDYITCDKKCRRMISKAKKIAKSDLCVLIQGESGTGKEILAQAIHNASKRYNENFVAVNFAAIQPSLLESELFGYVEGAFTGAKKGGRRGFFEKAHRGTLFIDEIGDAPLSFQIRLLRVLQEKEIRRVGDSDRIPVDVRIIVATNKDLVKLVERGEFREDLFYRINVMPVDVPALRERKCDIGFLLNHYIKIFSKRSNVTIYDICSEKLIKYLYSYSWKGNVRELINLIEYFTYIKEVKKLDIDDLPKYMKKASSDTFILSDIERKILSIIAETPKIGRYRICKELRDNGFEIKEGKVRGIVADLKKKGFIIINNTRGGCEIAHNAFNVTEYIDIRQTK